MFQRWQSENEQIEISLVRLISVSDYSSTLIQSDKVAL
jgi:hypothetical protein